MGAVVLIIAAPMLAEFAMKFTTIEYFWLATLGLSASVMVSRGSLIKGSFSLLFGLALSTVGVDIALGFPRFTFGNVELLNGINFIPARSGISLNFFRASLAPSFVCWHCWFGFSRSLWAFYRKGFKTPKRSLKIKMEVFVRVYVTVNHPSSGFSR
ncbi:MAG: tripartite tricarboxylate transporter permease [Desulfobacterales bacterium]|nr:MAG: tripartite tricarboxylate transporter permease [Desulfobacterales bacterium]